MVRKMKKITINTEYITLGQFLKFANIISNGGEAKSYLAYNEVYINDELDVRRGRKLRHGDKVVVEEQEFIIENENQ